MANQQQPPSPSHPLLHAFLHTFQPDPRAPAKSAIFDHQLRRMLKDIENYVGDDPLEPWLRCIKWARETFPSDGLKSALCPLLELCAKTFQQVERYRDDIRYLRVWIRYADCCSDDEDKFAIMEAHKIGQGHSLFYEAYATYMEIRRNFLKASELYQRGLSRNAQPVGRLENMYKSFLQRMNKRAERRLQKGKEAPALGRVEESFHQGDHVNVIAPGANSAQSDGQVMDTRSSELMAGVAQPFKQAHNTGPGVGQAQCKVVVPKAKAESRAILQVFTQDSSKSLIGSAKGASQSLELKPFVDEEFRECPSELQVNHVKSESQHDGHGLSSIYLLSTAGLSSRAVLAFDKSILSYGGRERCFEEARMISWLEEQPKLCYPSSKLPEEARDGYQSCLKASNSNSNDNSHQTVLCSMGRLQVEEQTVEERDVSAVCDTHRKKYGVMEDQNQCLKEIEPVERLDSSLRLDQNDNLFFESCGDIVNLSNNTSGRGCPTEAATVFGDETVAIKKFVEAAVVLKDGHDFSSEEFASHRGLVEPTINTKEALADILSMFNKPLTMQVSRPKRTSEKGKRDSAIQAASIDNFQVYTDEHVGFQNHSNELATNIAEKNHAGPLKGRGNWKVKDCCEEEKENANIQSNKISSILPEVKWDENHKKVEGLNNSLSMGERINPWNDAIVNNLLKSLIPPLSDYEGFHNSNKKYSGTTNLFSLRNGARNKTLELGHSKYHLKGCTGQGAFAQVYQAHDEENFEKTVILKIQKPACPLEFYMYRQLDERIPKEERSSFGYAWKMHAYADCSIMVCDYGEHGTLQDVVNSYLATGQKMDEVLCMYYTIEMLRMLETLHSVGLIHGDFKPDNLLIRNDSEKWEDWAPGRPGCWKNQGLCLIDWGRSIDMKFFPIDIEFLGDCKTSGFRCIEMQEGRPWTYQVDTYGLCSVVHTMLHGTYMEVVVEAGPNSTSIYSPKAPFKRYWNRELWRQFFTTLLNVKSCKENPSLGPLRSLFEDYLMSNAQLPKKLKQLLMKQSIIMYSNK